MVLTVKDLDLRRKKYRMRSAKVTPQRVKVNCPVCGHQAANHGFTQISSTSQRHWSMCCNLECSHFFVSHSKYDHTVTDSAFSSLDKPHLDQDLLFPCPACHSPTKSSASTEQTLQLRKHYRHCTNVECGHEFVGYTSFSYSVHPSLLNRTLSEHPMLKITPKWPDCIDK